jgi:hypothetical protein
MAKKFWKISGYEGTRKLFETVLPLGSLSEREVTALLQRLAATALTPEEIVNASLRRTAKSYAALLEPQQERRQHGGRFLISVGVANNYVASVWDANELASTVSNA